MKLLLTSNGLVNESITKALFDLVGKRPEETSLVFVPTASNIETGDKTWVIDDLINVKRQNFKSISIADISAVPEDVWRPQFEGADVIFFEGGDSYHLMQWLTKSGLEKVLPELLQTKVYVGISAGSMIAGPDLDLRLSKVIYGERAEEKSVVGLGYVDFYFLPHLNSPEFAVRTEDTVREAMGKVTRKTYVLDDQSALKVVDSTVEVVGGGKYLEFN